MTVAMDAPFWSRRRGDIIVVESVAVGMVMVSCEGGGGGNTTLDTIVGDAADKESAEEKNVSSGQSGYKISGRDGQGGCGSSRRIDTGGNDAFRPARFMGAIS